MRIDEFDESQLEEAAALLADRLGEDLQARLSAIDPSPTFCDDLIRAAWNSGARGVVASDAGGMAGYLIAVEGDNDRGRHVWSGRECHAYRDDPEVLRHAYGALAGEWVRDGRDHHYAVVSATDTPGLSAWLDLTFGHEQAHALMMIEPAAPTSEAVEIRRAGRDDKEMVEPLVRLIYEANSGSPVFAYIEPSWWDELLEGHIELLGDTHVGYFVAQDGDALVGYATLRPVPDDEATILKPRGTVELIVAGTIVEARGRGVMRALIQRALSWSAAEGYSICVTDWRVANLGASRAWRALGFEPCAYRLHRIIDSRYMASLRY